MQFIIAGIKKSSLLDYPEKISAIVFTPGCNFRCGYCHNPGLINSKEGIITNDAFFEFLRKRKGKLDGVVITGGEPTLQKDLKAFTEEIKNLGFLVKLDTNGSNSNILRELINENLVDYVAMDIKSPLNKYEKIINKKINTDNISKSIEIIMSSGIDYEFRTTVMSSMLKTVDFIEIGNLIKGAKKYYLQKFTVKSDILDNSLNNEKTYTDIEFEEIIKILKEYIPNTFLRT